MPLRSWRILAIVVLVASTFLMVRPLGRTAAADQHAAGPATPAVNGPTGTGDLGQYPDPNWAPVPESPLDAAGGHFLPAVSGTAGGGTAVRPVVINGALVYQQLASPVIESPQFFAIFWRPPGFDFETPLASAGTADAAYRNSPRRF